MPKMMTFEEAAHHFCTKGAGDREWSEATRQLQNSWRLAEVVRRHQHTLIPVLEVFLRMESCFTRTDLTMHNILSDFRIALLRDKGVL